MTDFSIHLVVSSSNQKDQSVEALVIEEHPERWIFLSGVAMMELKESLRNERKPRRHVLDNVIDWSVGMVEKDTR